MSNINRMVLDLSHHEEVDSYAAVKSDGIEGIIYKATQGSSYTDKTYKENRERAINAGLLWGSYHFGDNSTVEAQINNYLNFATPKPTELICLDFERNNHNTMTLAQARAFIEGVEQALDRPLECVIYSGDLLKEALGDREDPFWGARRLWLAQYGTTPKVQKSWQTYWLWQYTDGDVGPEPHHVKGIKEGIDCNSFQRDAAYLKAEWNGGNIIEPPTPVLPEVILTIQATPGVKVTVKGP